MKKLKLSLCAIPFAMLVNYTVAQNPKTNAGKMNENKNYPAPKIQHPTPQPSVKPDYNNYKRDTAFIEDNQPAQQQQDNTQSPSSTSSNSNVVLFSAGLIVGLTQNQFREATNNDWGIGLGITFMYNFMGTNDEQKKAVNIFLGGTFEYLYFGGKSSSYEYDDPYPYNAISNKVTTKVNSNIYSLLLVSRIEFFKGPVIPFIEGAVGGRLFDGKEKVTVERTQRPGTSLPWGVTFSPTTADFPNNLQSDFTGTYGYGGGLRIGNKNLKVEFKLMYMRGTKGRYIDNESIKFDQAANNVTYDTKTSTTDMLIPQIGISATF